MNNIALICPTHDPAGGNIAFIRTYAGQLREIYRDIYITVSDESDNRVVRELVSA
ncbi:hypothetical protein GCM10023310_16090 [Paenibacillus vulneris]|uniref:Glycosyltransferase 2-like domain-containing protein n=1 Tax=Paenibacillus vulneris TaxID=1133364 RepID=A0ABW3UHR6_9BACL